MTKKEEAMREFLELTEAQQFCVMAMMSTDHKIRPHHIEKNMGKRMIKAMRQNQAEINNVVGNSRAAENAVDYIRRCMREPA